MLMLATTERLVGRLNAMLEMLRFITPFAVAPEADVYGTVKLADPALVAVAVTA